MSSPSAAARRINVGLVSLWWPPVFSGGEQYTYRLATGLRDLGVSLSVFTASPLDPRRWNGRLRVKRSGNLPPPVYENRHRLIAWFHGAPFRAWRRELAHWLRQGEFTHVLAHVPPLHRTPELFATLRATGATVGVIHHEPPTGMSWELSPLYAQTGNWDEAGEILERRLRRLSATLGARRFDERFQSRLAEKPDFIVSASHWSARFIDFRERVPKFVLHPRLSDEHPRGRPRRLPRVDVGLINPLVKKGGLQAANIILSDRHRWSFRVLRGGWGGEFPYFQSMIGEALAGQRPRVQIQSYVKDMRSFFRSLRVYLFPSRIEGYGLAPVEAMAEGTPVVATDFPAIGEGVGDGALRVGYFADTTEWIDALERVLADPKRWKSRAKARVKVLREREASELQGLAEFLAKR